MNLREFQTWALSQGVVGNPTKENSYKGECVSLVQQYLNKVHGLEFKARGNAKDWANIEIEGFNRFDVSNTLKAGDIIVWNYGKFGHIALITADGKILEQNRDNNRVVTAGDVRQGYVMIHRPASVDLGTIEENLTVENDGRVEQHATFTASVNGLRVRRAPSLNGVVVAHYNKGGKVNYDSCIDYEGYRWISYIGKSGHRNYIARRKLDNSKIFGTCE